MGLAIRYGDGEVISRAEYMDMRCKANSVVRTKLQPLGPTGSSVVMTTTLCDAHWKAERLLVSIITSIRKKRVSGRCKGRCEDDLGAAQGQMQPQIDAPTTSPAPTGAHQSSDKGSAYTHKGPKVVTGGRRPWR